MKYKLTTNFIIQNNKKLYQIQSLKIFSKVEVGELGGYIESEKNLSQEGDCWISNNATVYDDATVYDEAIVCDNATVYGRAKVYGDCWICGDDVVCDDAKVYGMKI